MVNLGVIFPGFNRDGIMGQIPSSIGVPRKAMDGFFQDVKEFMMVEIPRQIFPEIFPRCPSGLSNLGVP